MREGRKGWIPQVITGGGMGIYLYLGYAFLFLHCIKFINVLDMKKDNLYFITGNKNKFLEWLICF
jgi:hypothetical protein